MTSTLQDLPIDQVTCAPQVRERFTEESLAGLAASMGEVGLLQPIRVRPVPDGWVVIDGERRLRAARQLGWVAIPALVEASQAAETAALWQQLAANLQREDLSPLETALGIDRLMREAGWSAAQVAAQLGLSPATVSKLLAILVLPKEVQHAVHVGQVAASTAYEIAKVRKPKERAHLIKAALKGGLTRDKAAKQSRSRRVKSRATSEGVPPVPSVALTLSGGRSAKFSGPALATSTLVAWLEELLERVRRVVTPEMDLVTLANTASDCGEK